MYHQDLSNNQLVLTSANVFGRILKPDGNPARYVHFWIFEDTNGDGLFDWDGDGKREYDGETDNNGYFNVTVDESSYGIEFHLPPHFNGIGANFNISFSINSDDSKEKDFGTIKLSKTSKTISGTAEKIGWNSLLQAVMHMLGE